MEVINIFTVFIILILSILVYILKSANNSLKKEKETFYRRSEAQYKKHQEEVKDYEQKLERIHKIIETTENLNNLTNIRFLYAYYFLKYLCNNWNSSLKFLTNEDNYKPNPALRLSYDENYEKYDIKSYVGNKDLKDLAYFKLPINKEKDNMMLEDVLTLLYQGSNKDLPNIEEIRELISNLK